jgi:hypothetical protein
MSDIRNIAWKTLANERQGTLLGEVVARSVLGQTTTVGWTRIGQTRVLGTRYAMKTVSAGTVTRQTYAGKSVVG